jgi:hypothetical protein
MKSGRGHPRAARRTCGPGHRLVPVDGRRRARRSLGADLGSRGRGRAEDGRGGRKRSHHGPWHGPARRATDS